MVTALVIVTTAGVLLAGTAMANARRNRRQHSAALEQQAARLGWGYREEIGFSAIPDLDRFELFSQGTARKLRHLLTSPPGDPRAVIFEYAYTVSTGKSSHTYRQTVYYTTSENLRLPSFSLRPERYYHRIAAVFGYQDINIERRPEFSRMFVLRGDNEAAVRALFTAPVAEFFENKPGICAAGMGRELLYWRPGRVVKTGELEPFMREGIAITDRMLDTARRL